jgi:hypothetical protein
MVPEPGRVVAIFMRSSSASGEERRSRKWKALSHPMIENWEGACPMAHFALMS